MMLMARFYELWRSEGKEPLQAIHEAQRWVRDSTNGEKRDYFKAFLPGLSATRMSTETADTLFQTVVLSNPSAREFAHPYYWAAFSYVGV
jgi:CHAT domain-containing protein